MFLAAAIVAALGIVWWAVATRPPAVPDPVYAGLPLSYWVDPPVWAGAGVVPELDSNAVPYFVQALRTRDSGLRKAYGYGWQHLPAGLRTRLPAPGNTADLKMITCACLAGLGASARPAIPELIRVMQEDTDDDTRCIAALALGTVANGDDKLVVEALVIAATNNTDTVLKDYAGVALWELNPAAAAKAGITNPAASIPP